MYIFKLQHEREKKDALATLQLVRDQVAVLPPSSVSLFAPTPLGPYSNSSSIALLLSCVPRTCIWHQYCAGCVQLSESGDLLKASQDAQDALRIEKSKLISSNDEVRHICTDIHVFRVCWQHQWILPVFFKPFSTWVSCIGIQSLVSALTCVHVNLRCTATYTLLWSTNRKQY